MRRRPSFEASPLAHCVAPWILAVVCGLGWGCGREGEREGRAAEQAEASEPASAPVEPREIAEADVTGSPEDPCETLAEEFDAALDAADPSCESDADCGCSPGGVSERAGCGRVTSRAAATELGRIYAEFRAAKCSLVRHCAPRRCKARCVDGSCRAG